MKAAKGAMFAKELASSSAFMYSLRLSNGITVQLRRWLDDPGYGPGVPGSTPPQRELELVVTALAAL